MLRLTHVLYLIPENIILPSYPQGWVPGEVLLRYGPEPGNTTINRNNLDFNEFAQVDRYE